MRKSRQLEFKDLNGSILVGDFILDVDKFRFITLSGPVQHIVIQLR